MLQAQFEGSRILCVALSVFFLLFASISDSFMNFLMGQKRNEVVGKLVSNLYGGLSLLDTSLVKAVKNHHPELEAVLLQVVPYQHVSCMRDGVHSFDT